MDKPQEYIVDQDIWVDKVRQIVPSDRVLGGSGEPANWQAEDLANRTLWLKARYDEHTKKFVTVEANIKTAQTTANQAKTAAATADGKAVKAQTAADGAQATADSATSAAKAADTKAGTAQTTANQAKTAAATADGKAVKAQTAADGAQATADSATSAAKAADTKAGTAQTTANQAKTAAATADGKAVKAQTAADGAKAAADTAANVAKAADTKAGTAQTTADEAKTAAATADGKAVAAQTTANQAKTAASTADGKAVAAQTTANEAKTAASNADNKAVIAQTTADKKRDLNDRVFRGSYALLSLISTSIETFGREFIISVSSSGTVSFIRRSEEGVSEGQIITNLPLTAAGTFYTTGNTTPDRSGFLRVRGIENALVQSDCTSLLGDSDSLLASQKLVTDVHSKIKTNIAVTAITGWHKCGDTGVITQWGSATTNSLDDLTVRFPISFSSRCFGVQLTGWTGDKDINRAPILTSQPSKDLFTAKVNNPSRTTFYWQAIGL